MKKLLLLLFVPLLGASAEPIEIGSRWELFVDEFLISQKQGLELKLHEPDRREIVLTTDQPWEGHTCAYFTAIQDGKTVRLYYRGSAGGSDHSIDQVTCVVESTDGIRFIRPKLNIIEASGTRENNIIWRGVESHNFSPFLDLNPKTHPEERYKALGGIKEPGKNWHQGDTPGGLYAFVSADGLHWKKARPDPVITKGAFDSQNLAFWDQERSRYIGYSRIFSNKVRAIQSSTSSDFFQWSEGVANRYAEGVPMEHFYTSATVPCPTAPHLFFAFPKRYVTNRTKVIGHGKPGISDAVFMSSRDGVKWDRPFLEAWVRPGPDPKNWTERNNMTACGIIETSETEWSLYISEHYRHADHRIRRLSVRKQGFASIHAGAREGVFVTHPLKVTGNKLILNYSTSAAGSIRVEIQDEKGQPMPGFETKDMPELFGDEVEATVSWKAGTELPKLDKPIRLKFTMKDADVFAFRFAP